MNRIVKNDKVIKAITVGLAAMITATSSPIPVFADDEISNTQSENNENVNTQSESNPISETAGDCSNIINENNNQITEATEAISGASDAIGEIITSAEEQEVQVPAEVLMSMQNELQQSANELTQAEGDLKISVQAFNETLVSDLAVDADIKNAQNDITDMQNAITDFNNANIDTTQKANDTIDQAKIANTSGSKDEAYAAKDNAVKGLAETEKQLKIAEAALKVAKDASEAADEKYQAALTEQKKTKEKLAEAKDKLKDASENANASNERLKAIQSQMDQLDKEVITLAQSKDDLKALEEQYHKLLVHYYRDPAINSAVYDDNGKLLPKDSANKAVADGKTDKQPALSENTMKVGRELMKDLVIYKLKANGAEDIQFAVQEKGLTKKQSADGELTVDNKGNEKVNITETQDQYWKYPSGDDGRHHRVKVTYTITTEDGTKQEVTEYYNYIIKAGKYSDNTDMVNGPVYLAQINDETGEVVRDTDKNNMDDYIKLGEELNKAIDAIKVLDEYNKAKKAVDDAQSLVNSLNTTIKTLSEKDLKVNEQKIKDLKEKLDDAKKILADATKDKETLEDKVEEARKAVAAIDLSRFKEATETDEVGPEESSESSTTEEIPAIIPSDIVTDSVSPTLPSTVSTSSTVSVSTAGDISEDAGDAEDTAAGVAGAKVENTDNTAKPKLVKIGNNEVPLASIPTLTKDHSIFWWIGLGWLLLLLAYIIYKLSKKKEKEEEENKKK